MITFVREYLARAENLIYARNRTNAIVDIVQPRWYPGGADWEIVAFSARIRFDTGQLLEVRERFLRDRTGRWKRTFSYYFGESSDDDDGDDSIFLFDCHGLPGGEPHRHCNNGERLVVGDPRLNGFDPGTIEIADVLQYVDMYFDKQAFPWDSQ